jgi:hypothetical protein
VSRTPTALDPSAADREWSGVFGGSRGFASSSSSCAFGRALVAMSVSSPRRRRRDRRVVGQVGRRIHPRVDSRARRGRQQEIRDRIGGLATALGPDLRNGAALVGAAPEPNLTFR